MLRYKDYHFSSCDIMEAEGVHGMGWRESHGFSGKSAKMATDVARILRG